jgi:hypothetical protein
LLFLDSTFKEAKMNRIRLVYLYHALNVLFLGLPGDTPLSHGAIFRKGYRTLRIQRSGKPVGDRGFEIILIYSMPFIITILLYTIAFLLVPWVAKKHLNT